MAYSLILSCCCYTCCIRSKLRKMLNIRVNYPSFWWWIICGRYISCLLSTDIVCQGGYVDDFLSHLMCCCCALVQEWREVEIRGASGMTDSMQLFQHSRNWNCLSFNLKTYWIAGPEKTNTRPPPSQYMES